MTSGRNVVELGLPLVKYRLRKHMEARQAGTSKKKDSPAAVSPGGADGAGGFDGVIRGPSRLVREVDEQMAFESYGQASLAFDGTIDDYLELAITFGFLTLFSITFPGAGLLSFLCCLFEIYVDSYKLKHMVRRPIPQAAQSIGVWYSIFNAIALAAIFTNATILTFAANIKAGFLLEPIMGAERASNPMSAWVLYVIVFILIKMILMSVVKRNTGSALRVADRRMNHVLNLIRHPPVTSALRANEEKHNFLVKSNYDGDVLQGRWEPLSPKSFGKSKSAEKPSKNKGTAKSSDKGVEKADPEPTTDRDKELKKHKDEMKPLQDLEAQCADEMAR